MQRSEGEGRTIEGLAIVWDSPSEVLYDPRSGRSFTEVIHYGAVDNSLLSASDVLCLYEHDRKSLLGRCNCGEGSMTLTIDERGLVYTLDLPKTTLGEDVRELIARGDLRNSSFAFMVDEGGDRWERKEDGTWIRHVHRLSWLGDVSVVSLPAYTQTSVSARSIEALEDEAGDTNTPQPHTRTPRQARALKWADLHARK